MKQTKLIHLYSVAGNSPYKVSRALLVERNVDPTCSEQTERYERDYFVISCYGTHNCDDRFTQEGFFDSLDQKVVSDAMQEDSLPRCETGNVTFTTPDTNVTMPPEPPITMRVVSLYCIVRMTVDTDKNNTTATSITFGPKFPKPQNCSERVALRDDFSHTCCYDAYSKASQINKDCDYTTILEKAFPPEADATSTDATTESVDLTPQQSVFEYTDYCEQSNMGDFGVPSLLCQPGGFGCFHLLEVDEARDKVSNRVMCRPRGGENRGTRKVLRRIQ
uniref:CUB domain-containing protein n=1 Tax=Panagrellus redivivus TaxID=6233 RepID=A0A7E4UXQ4_PANRE